MSTSPKHYFCEACQVFGQGVECWCCGAAVDELVTEGPVVDAHVYDEPTSAHVSTGRRRPRG